MTGVQTCALPIYGRMENEAGEKRPCPLSALFSPAENKITHITRIEDSSIKLQKQLFSLMRSNQFPILLSTIQLNLNRKK